MHKRWLFFLWFIGILSIQALIGTILNNLTQLKIVQSWMSLKLQTMTRNDALQDNIPDNWRVQVWEGATAIYRLSEQGSFGERALYLEHTNNLGVVSIMQTLEISPSVQFVGTVYAKGGAGALQVLGFTRLGQQQSIGWVNILPGDIWQKYQVSFKVPADVQRLEVRLRTQNTIWFDEVYIGVVDEEGRNGPNLLLNPSFEQDGVSEEPFKWWKDQVVLPGSPVVSQDISPDRLSYLNLLDMMAGHYEAIQKRAKTLGDNCVLYPEMTGWLLAWGDQFEKEGGKAARERLYQLAIELMPSCPQPYAALANFYAANGAFCRAAELYRQAADLSGITIQAGRYAFEEGFIHIRYTGRIEEAVLTLQKAEQFTGWESGEWYRGIAPLYLGQALEMQGHSAEAREAYQRVLECKSCSYHHKVAQERLNILLGNRISE